MNFEKDFYKNDNSNRLTCGVPFFKERNVKTCLFYDLLCSEWKTKIVQLPLKLSYFKLNDFLQQNKFRKIEVSIPECMSYRNSVLQEFTRRKQQKEQSSASAAVSVPQQAQEAQQPLQVQSVIFGPGKRQLTLQEVSDLGHPSTSGHRQAVAEPPAKKAAVEQAEAPYEPLESNIIVISSSSSTDVED